MGYISILMAIPTGKRPALASRFIPLPAVVLATALVVGCGSAAVYEPDSSAAAFPSVRESELTTGSPPEPAVIPTARPRLLLMPSPVPTAASLPRPTPAPVIYLTPVPVMRESRVTPAPAATLAPAPSATLAPTFSPVPTAAPTPPPTSEPTPAPVPTPTPNPTASSPPEPTPTSTSAPTLTPIPTPTPTPIPLDPGIVIECIFFDGVIPRSEADEYVQLRNNGGGVVELKDWKLTDLSDETPEFTFGAYALEPGGRIRVYTNQVHPEWGGFSFGRRSSIWHNTEPDTAGLFSPDGRLVAQRTYPPGCE